MLRLVSAAPSPYARKVRIALMEKGIPFELSTEVPWDSTTQTPQFNPLEKLPILVLPDKGPESAVFESYYILEYLEAKHPNPPLFPADIDEKLAAKQVEVVAGGACDAMVLYFFENLREQDRQSPEWKARQLRKVEGGIKWLADQVEKSGADGESKFLVGGRFGLADIAAGSCLAYSLVRLSSLDWAGKHPALKRYLEGLEKRKSFQETKPSTQAFKDKIV